VIKVHPGGLSSNLGENFTPRCKLILLKTGPWKLDAQTLTDLVAGMAQQPNFQEKTIIKNNLLLNYN
jgi:hypothetical protein